MTSEAQRQAIIEMIRRKTDEALRSPEASRAALVKLGVYTADGKLTPEYGG